MIVKKGGVKLVMVLKKILTLKKKNKTNQLKLTFDTNCSNFFVLIKIF